MQTLLIQTRIAALWIVAAVAMSAHMILMCFDPAVMNKVAAGAISGPGAWVLLALFWLVPLWMAFLAVTLRFPANRVINCVAGVIFTMVGIWHFFICGVPLLPGGPFTEATPHHVLLVGSSAVATALAAWYAWRCPAPKA